MFADHWLAVPAVEPGWWVGSRIAKWIVIRAILSAGEEMRVPSMLAMLFTVPLFAQKPKAAVRERKIEFTDAKPVLGLPSDVGKVSGLCSRDGLSYFAGSADASSARDLYSVSTSAEVKHILRKLPVDFTDVLVKSFFPSEHTVVTLLEASNRDKPDEAPRGTSYFLSLTDPGGGESDLLELTVRFKPLKIGAFGSGDFLLLGWDTANDLPLLARLKEDGTVRRFVDTAVLLKAGSELGELSKAALVPYGDNILLTFPGTAQPVWIMRDRGEDRSWTLPIPAGYVLRDVLGSDGGPSLVFRVQTAGSEDEAKMSQVPVAPRLFELSWALTELKLGAVPTTAVTCAAWQSVTAIWMQVKGTPAGEKEGLQKQTADVPQQLVVRTVRR